jgi:hypothetical protein
VVAVVKVLVVAFPRTRDSIPLAVEAEVATSTTCSGRRPMRSSLLQLTTAPSRTTRIGHKDKASLKTPYMRVAMRLKRQSLRPDHPKKYKWRGLAKKDMTIQTRNLTVMINHLLDRLGTINSASPSSPKLLLRLRLNLLQILISRKALFSRRTTSRLFSRHRGPRTRISILIVVTPRGCHQANHSMNANSHLPSTTADSPTSSLRATTADQIVHDLPGRRN